MTLCALALNLLVAAVPDLAPYRPELLIVITALALGLIGGIAYEDAARAGLDAGTQPQQSDADLLKELLTDVIDTITQNAEGQTVITLKNTVKKS